MAYTPTVWTGHDKVTSTKLNKIEQGIASAGGYDLILTMPLYDASAEDIEIIEGDILECEQRVADDEIVKGLLVVQDAISYTPSGANAPQISQVFELSYWSCPYCWICFSNLMAQTNEANALFVLKVVNIEYDPTDGSIVGFNAPYKFID